MATKQFIDLSNLQEYDRLLKNYVAAEDAKSIKSVVIENNNLKFYAVENPTAQDVPKYNITLPQPDLSNFVEKVIEGSNGKALVFNESDGGGLKFEHKDGTWSFAGVNDGGANGLAAQIYAVNKDTKVGTRINVTTSGIYYTNGNSSMAYTAGDEIATKKDVQGDAGSKTVYVVETSGGSQDPFSKKYDFYQGANGSSQSPDPSEKLTTIAIAKDMFVESGTVGTVTVADEPYPGAKVGDKYIDLVLANSSSDHIYIPANSLVDVYTGGTTNYIQVSIDGNNQITATIVDGSIGRTKLDADVNEALVAGESALQPEDIEPVDQEDIEALFE
jgi:hypothetical protein